MPHRYPYNEFLLDLPYHWRQYANPDPAAVSFHSKALDASLIVSVQALDGSVADQDAEAAAASNLDARIDAYSQQFPGRLAVLHKSVERHWTGRAFEGRYTAEVEDQAVLQYIGHVTPRKIQSALLITKPDRAAASGIFDSIMQGYFPRTP